jgi:hypothetical protein
VADQPTTTWDELLESNPDWQAVEDNYPDWQAVENGEKTDEHE